jgi:hypothetical protein
VLGQAIGAAMVAFLLGFAPQGGAGLALDAAAAIAVTGAAVSAARGFAKLSK